MPCRPNKYAQSIELLYEDGQAIARGWLVLLTRFPDFIIKFRSGAEQKDRQWEREGGGGRERERERERLN